MPTTRRTIASDTTAEIRGGHAGHLRRANLERVQAFVMDHPEAFTRAELIEATGLSAPTVGSLVTHLIRRGLVRDLGAGPSRGGRRPSFMEFNARYGFVAAIAIGADKTQLAVADLRGERLGSRVEATPRDLEAEPRLSGIARSLGQLCAEAKASMRRLLAVSVATPGLVDPVTGTVRAINPGLKGWSKLPVAEVLRKALGVDVLVENDVNLAVVGEHWRGAAQGHDTCAYVLVGAGIGAGVLIEGKLHHGQHVMAGEIAFMAVTPRCLTEDLGPHGCLEALAGLDALAARWPQRPLRDPDRWVAELYEAARAGDATAAKAVDEAATLVGIATANLSLVIDPSLVVLGGTIPTQGSPFVERVQRTVARIVPPPITVAGSALGEEAPLWGGLLTALAHARQRLRPRLLRRQAS